MKSKDSNSKKKDGRSYDNNKDLKVCFLVARVIIDQLGMVGADFLLLRIDDQASGG